MKTAIFEFYDSATQVWNKFSDDKIILEKGELPPPPPPVPTKVDEIEAEKKKIELQNKTSESLSQKLKAAIQMPNIMVLAGSGTSLGPIVKGPSMWNLWELCTTNEMEALSKATFIENGYDLRLSDEEYKNIELCLSHCEAHLQISPEHKSIKTKDFILKCKDILCTRQISQNPYPIRILPS